MLSTGIPSDEPTPQYGDDASVRPAAAPVNAFRRLWELGYRRLVPIVPPQAELSPHSSLAKRPACRGKAVGELGQHGWKGLNWHTHETTEADLDRWFEMGAGVGTRTGAGLIAIDIDTIDPTQAAAALAAALEIFGDAPRRIGRAPKVLLPYRTDPTVETQYQRVDFITPFCKLDQRGNPVPERVEILGKGRQYVTGGIHPTTMRPYSWPDGVPAYDELTLVSPEQIKAYFDRLLEIMPQASQKLPSSPAADRNSIDQAALRGELKHVRAVVEAMPNGTKDRERWVALGYALKAALPDDREDAFALWWEHSLKWNPDKDYDAVWREWVSFGEGPFEIGAAAIERMASGATGMCMVPAAAYFDVVDPASVDTSGFLTASADRSTAQPSATDTFRLLGIDGLLRMSDPKYLIGRHLPENALGFLYGDPGTGKSFIALDWALHIAFGLKTWHGDPIDAPADAHVVYIAGEGVAGLKSRVRAWMHRYAVDDAHARFSLLTHSVNMMDRDEVQKLARTIRAGAPGTVLVVVDTVSRSMPGADENQQKEMTRFVQACDVIRCEFQCVVLGVHHAARQGGNMRGSTVLGAAGDFTFKLERKPNASAGKLTCEKQKDAPDGWSEPYRFDTVAYTGGSSLVSTRCLTADGDGAPVPAAQEEQILEAIDEAWRRGEPWGQSAHSRDRYAVTRLAKGFGFEAGRAQELIRTLEDQGLIAAEIVDRKSKKAGYRRVITEKVAPPTGSVFD